MVPRNGNKRKLIGRGGFTLVELLVVIAIIGMLMALLMPAVSSARESARRTQCVSQQKQLITAALSYESSKKSFPGWRNTVPSVQTPVTWTAMLLPNLERNDLWQLLKKNDLTYKAKRLQFLICPSDPADVPNDASSAYVANGLVFREAMVKLVNGKPTLPIPPRSAEFISGNDGTSNTIAFGEHLRLAKYQRVPHYWGDCDTVDPKSTFQFKQTFGVPLGTPYPTDFQTFTTVYPVPAANVNLMEQNLQSSHGGGAVVAFFDGSVRFLRDDVGLTWATGSNSTLRVFQILVTPDGSTLGGQPAADESQW